MHNSPLRRSSAGMGRTNHKLQPKKKKSSLKSGGLAPSKDAFFFEEWMPGEKSDQATNDPAWSPTDTELHIIEEEESTKSPFRREVDNEPKIKKRFLEYYVTMRASEECPLFPEKCSVLVIEGVLKYYNSFSERNYSLCSGLSWEIPCIIQIGGILACTEFERLSLNPKFSKWIDNLTDFDSVLCVIVNQLVRESNSLVRCWWSSENQCFVLFCHITIKGEKKKQAVEIVKPIPIRPRVITVKTIPIRPCTQYLPEEGHKD